MTSAESTIEPVGLSEAITATVLLVDDRPDNLLALSAVLEPLELRLLTAHSGKEALAQLLREEVMLIIMDVQMPGLDGFETAALIRGRKRTREIPVIFVSAIHRDPSHATRGYGVGAVDYLNKPFDPEVLIAKVSALVAAWRAGESVRRQQADEHRAERGDLLARETAARSEAEHSRAEEFRLRLMAEEANRAKDVFLSTLSHELRTPLTAILGWTRILQTGSLGPEKRERALQTIDRNAQSQLALIEDILDISRAVTGKMRLETRQVDIAQIAEVALESVRPIAAAKGIQLASSIDPEIGTVTADPNRVQQILWNLLSNALKFSRPGGRVELRAHADASGVELAVRDDGIGISPEFLPHVFERFRQADASTTRTEGGLGLGLAIVKHLAELHGGTIRADSEGIGRGAVFTVRLPMVAVRPISRPIPAPVVASFNPPRPIALPRLDGVRVLTVDDNADVRDLIVAILEKQGAIVSAAEDANAAIAAIRNSPPDVFISNIGVPTLDGNSVIERVRALPAEHGGETPAVALTAFVQSQDRTRALASGFDSYVCKPIDEDELVIVIASLVRRLAKRN